MEKNQKLTQKQTVLLALIRSQLWGEEEPKNPEIALDEAGNQALLPLLFPDSMDAFQGFAHYMRILHLQDELVAFFQNGKVPMLILKGTAAAVYYPEPMKRTMGDIDLIVPRDQFESAQSLMLQNGFQQTSEENEQDPRHISYLKDGLSVELHQRFSSNGIDVEQYVQLGFEKPVKAEVSGHEFPMLPPMENGLVLLAHVAQHLRNGLGLRQMIDWMMYVHAQLTDDYWRTIFQSAAADCGLETLAITSTRLCQIYLGLPDPITWCDGADEKLVEDLLENLLITGNFGHAHGTGSSVETVATNIKRTGLFRYLQQQGEHNWKAYQEHKALKPFCWAYQIGRYIHRGIGTGRSGIQLAEDYSRSKTRYDLLTRLGID